MRVRSAVLPAAFGLLTAPALAGGEVECIDCYRHVVRPPVYGTVAEQVMVRAPRTIAHAIPGQYGAVAEKVMVSPPRMVWQAGRDPYGRPIGCWVLVQHRAVMLRPPEVVHHAVPGVYATHHRTVMVQPGSSGWQRVGGGYGNGYGGGFGAGYNGDYGGGAVGALAATAGGIAAGPAGAFAAGVAVDAFGY